MNKKTVSVLFYVLSALLVIGFAVRLGVDYFKLYEFGSAPFYLYVIVRFAEFILPAAVSFVVGYILQNKSGKPE